MFNSQSKVPMIITSIYAVLVVIAFIIMFATIETDSFSGIFVVFLAMPWSIVFASLIESIGVDSMIIKTLFMLVGAMINTFLIYTFFSFMTRSKAA
ncbi:MAG: hypothetical protein GQ582_13320 [Methyloprofundus sp.]|nr:hypothetical protein [Methyloprofundus sp.]